MNPLISVIVPVYNREKQIWFCLQSIQLQKFKNFEVIIIDDGSTDSTASICQDFCKKDKRFNYIYQSNSGVSVARNRGILVAKGEWITFVDSDDALLNTHLSVLCDYNVTNDCLVMVSQDGGKWNDIEFVPRNPQNDESIKDISGNKEIVDYLFGDFQPYKNQIYAVWNKFFRRNIIEKGIKFNEDLSLGEDQVFFMDYLEHVYSLKYVNRKSYLHLNWENVEHLGGKLRTPENYWKNEYANYLALNKIAQRTPSLLAKKYAINYLYDRPFRHILYQYSKKSNRNNYTHKEIISFFQQNIRPVFVKESPNLEFLNNKKLRILAKMVINESISFVYWYFVGYHKIQPLVIYFKKLKKCPKLLSHIREIYTYYPGLKEQG